jgi:hypothetical protein
MLYWIKISNKNKIMKTDVRLTSLFAYHGEVKEKMGRKQELVMEKFYEAPVDNMTNSELAYALNWPINTITPRVYELRHLGKITEDGKRHCKITGRLAISWKIKEQQYD